MNSAIRFASPVLIVLVVMMAGCSKMPPSSPAEAPSAKAVAALAAGHYDDARQHIYEAIDQDRDASRDSVLAEDYLMLGYLYRQTGQYDSIIPTYQHVAVLGHSTGDSRVERRGRLALSEFFLASRSFREAGSEAAGAATLSGLQADWQSVYDALSVLEMAERHLHQFDQAARTLDSLGKLDSAWFAGAHVYAIAAERLMLYRDWRKLPEMGQAFDQWRIQAGAKQDNAAMIDALLTWSEGLEAIGRYDTASHFYPQALTLLNFVRDTKSQYRVLSDLGSLALRSGKMDDALRYYRDALEQATQGKFYLAEEMLRLQIVGCQWLQRKQARADSNRFDRDIERIRNSYPATGIVAAEAFASFLQGRLADQRHQPAAALKRYREAVDLYERDALLRNPENFCSRLVDAFLTADASDWYGSPLAVYCAAQNGVEALLLNERRNHRDLMNFFSEVPMTLPSLDAGQAVKSLQQYAAFERLRQEDLNRELERGESRNAVRMQSIVQHVLVDAGTLAATQARLPVGMRWLFSTDVPTVRQVRDSLPAGAALVEYIPAPTTLYSLVVRHESVYVRQAPMERGKLTELLSEYGRLVSMSDASALENGIPQIDDGLSTISSALGDAFFAPAQPLLSSVTTVYVVQSPEIGWLPVHTLRHGTVPAAAFTVRYLPDAGALLLPRNQSPYVTTVTGFGFAGRTSWDVDYELNDIRSFYREVKLLLDTAATASQLRAAGYDILHLCVDLSLERNAPGGAVIGVSNGRVPAGPEEFVFGDFPSLPLSQTIIFSNIAAQPGGLSRYAPALMLAEGTPTVIGTLWQGDRKTKKYFGELFYTAIIAGLPSGEAYHQAMVKLAGSDEYDSPRQYGVYYLWGK